MEKPKPEQKTEQSATTPVQTQDPVVVAMSERKPNPEESVQVINLTEDANIKMALDTGSTPENHSEHSVDRVMSPKKSVHWSPELVSENSYSSLSHPDGSNPYVTRSLATPSSFNFKDTVSNVRDVLGRWGKKVGEATKKAEVLAGNTWQHLKTSPSLTEAALGRIAQGTKVIAEGGYEKIFRQTFETVPEETLQNSYACYLSTSAGPVMGVLYVSTAKLAFCSDNPLSYKSGDQTEWSYYKVVIPLHQIKAVNPSTSGLNPAEKFIQVISVDNHEFWFMGFLNYEGAVSCLQEASRAHDSQSV